MTNTASAKRLGKVLLADDDPGDIYLIEQAFEQLGIADRLVAVKNGNEALSYLKREGEYRDAENVQMALIDLNMPGMNGLDVLHRVKHDPALEFMPVLIITTSERASDVKASYARGAASYIVKPAHFNELADLMHKVVMYWTTVSRCPDRS
jgi:CheY-like chemotaxis protein